MAKHWDSFLSYCTSHTTNLPFLYGYGLVTGQVCTVDSPYSLRPYPYTVQCKALAAGDTWLYTVRCEALAAGDTWLYNLHDFTPIYSIQGGQKVVGRWLRGD